VRLLRANTLPGIFIPAVLPPNDRLEDEVVERFDAVPAMAGPFKDNVYAPTVNVPLASVGVPLTVLLAFSVTPPELLTVRLLSTEEDVGNSLPVVTPDEPVYVTSTDVPNVGAADKLPVALDIAALLPNVNV